MRCERTGAGHGPRPDDLGWEGRWKLFSSTFTEIMHRQGAQEIVECGIYPGMYFLMRLSPKPSPLTVPSSFRMSNNLTSQRDDDNLTASQNERARGVGCWACESNHSMRRSNSSGSGVQQNA